MAAFQIGLSSVARAAYMRSEPATQNPKWARDAIAECRKVGAALFLKQWGTYANNPLVAEIGLLTEEAKRLDPLKNVTLCRTVPSGGVSSRRAGRPGNEPPMPSREEQYPLGDDGLVVEKVGAWAKTKRRAAFRLRSGIWRCAFAFPRSERRRFISTFFVVRAVCWYKTPMNI